MAEWSRLRAGVLSPQSLLGEGAEWVVSEVLTRRVGYDARQHLNLLVEVAEHIREGKRVPTVSKSAQPFRLQPREATRLAAPPA